MRERFENGFEAWAGVVARWRHAVVLLSIAAAALSATQLPTITVDTSNESYLLEDDPARLAYDDLREQFGRDQVMIITLEPENIFDLEFLTFLKELHEALEDDVPHVDRVTSLINIRSVEGRDDVLVVGDLLEEMPASRAELEALRKRVLSRPSYRDTVISEDGRITGIIVETDAYSQEDDFDALAEFEDGALDAALGESGGERVPLTPEENSAVVETAKVVLARFERDDVVIGQAGSLMLAHEVTLSMLRELPIFFGGSLIVIAVALFVLFRRVESCLMALFVVTLSVLGTLGSLGAVGQPITLLTQILPSFMLSVGVGYSVHLLAIFFQRLDAGDARQAALVGALRHSGPPILMTALTTLAGLSSFLVATMPPVIDFGIAAIFGVAWTLVFNLTLLPALICILPMRGRRTSGGSVRASRLLQAIGSTSARHPWKVVVGAATLALASAFSTSFIRVSNDPIEYLAPDSAYRIAHDYIDGRFGGSATLELILETDGENGLYEPSVMNRIERLDAYTARFAYEGQTLGETTSVLDILKETHQALNANDSAFYAVPQDRALIAQELFLFENSGSEDLERVVDPQFQRARHTTRIRFAGGNTLARMIRELEKDLPEILEPEISWVMTGAMALIATAVDATSTSLIRTYTLALALITPLMMVMIGSLRAGLVSMAPNLLPILFTLGTMPLLGTPLDLFTMMVGCIAIGLAVDDTLHFIHGFRARHAAHGDPHRAIEETLHTTGRALLFTSIVLSVGFLVLTFSSMANLRALGGLTALSISAAFILDIIVTPALLVLVTPKRLAGGERV
jgi:predicted RND superfamily exporter protein